MEAKSKMAILIAKTGIFFANCDGEYDKKEHDFITRYVHELEQEENISEEVKFTITQTLSHKYTYDEIVTETRELLKNFNEVEQQAITEKLQEFITAVIHADNILHPQEAALFEKWKQDFTSSSNATPTGNGSG